MSENKHTPAITGFDAEFLSKRLGRVCARLGIAQPFGDNHESNAEVAGTTLDADTVTPNADGNATERSEGRVD